MTDDRPPVMFVAGAPGLDFLNTRAGPGDATIEWIGGGNDLAQWLGQAGLVPADALAALRARAGRGALDAVAGEARELREWFRGFVAGHKGRRLSRGALAEVEPLNRILARDHIYRTIVPRASHDAPAAALGWHAARRWETPAALLLPLAEAMADVICTTDFSHVKQCEGEGCSLVFLDTTRGHARRWCSMAICGNRAKQAAHRDRAKEAARPRSRR